MVRHGIGEVSEKISKRHSAELKKVPVVDFSPRCTGARRIGAVAYPSTTHGHQLGCMSFISWQTAGDGDRTGYPRFTIVPSGLKEDQVRRFTAFGQPGKAALHCSVNY